MRQLTKRSKWFIGHSLLISITIILLSTILHMSFSRIIIKEKYKSSIQLIETSVQAYNSTIKNAQMEAIHLYQDMAISKLLFYRELDIYDSTSSLKQLSLYNNLMPEIHSIYLMNSSNQKIYIKSSSIHHSDYGAFYDQDLMDYLKPWQIRQRLKAIPRILTDYDGSADPVFTIIYSEGSDQQDLPYAVVINLNSQTLFSSLHQEPSPHNARDFILDDRGRLIGATDKDMTFLDRQDNHPLLKGVLNQSESTGYQLTEFQGEEVLLSYIRDNLTGWYFIKLIPSKLFLADLRRATLITYVLSFILMAGGLITAYCLSADMRRYTHKLESENLLGKKNACQRKLSSIAAGNLSLPYNELMLLFADCDRAYRTEKGTYALVARLDATEAELNSKADNSEDTSLYRFTVLNVLQESLTREGYVTISLNHNSDSISLLVNLDKDQVTGMEQVLKDVQKWFYHNYDNSFSIGISQALSSENTLRNLLKQGDTALMERMIKGPATIAYYEGPPKEANDFETPKHYKDALTSFLTQGKLSEVTALYKDLLPEELSPLMVVRRAIHFAFDLEDILYQVSMDQGIQNDFDAKTSIDLINRAHFKSTIDDHFLLHLRKTCKTLHPLTADRDHRISHQVRQIVADRVSDPDLGLHSIASLVHLSPNHLARLYKQETGMTILTFITQHRMATARTLLTSTDQTISDIAKASGYASKSYFFKVFKKHHNITPSDYRQAH